MKCPGAHLITSLNKHDSQSGKPLPSTMILWPVATKPVYLWNVLNRWVFQHSTTFSFCCWSCPYFFFKCVAGIKLRICFYLKQLNRWGQMFIASVQFSMKFMSKRISKFRISILYQSLRDSSCPRKYKEDKKEQHVQYTKICNNIYGK